MARSSLPAGNNAVVVAFGDVRNKATGLLVTDAVVNCTVFAAGTATAVSGQIWPLSMPYEAGPQHYAGIISQEADIVAGEFYDIVVTATYGDYENQFVLRAPAKENRIDLTTV